MPAFIELADELEAAIESGDIPPGSRLQPQRDLAFRRGIAVSTVGRAYGELIRRGLAAGEVGRGTFVLAARDARSESALSGARLPAGINLQINSPGLSENAELLGPAIRSMLSPASLAAALAPASSAGSHEARVAGAKLLGGGWSPDPARIQFSAGGKQAIAAAVSALIKPGGRLAVESLTYPLVKAIAAERGVSLVPLAMDEQGVIPESISEAARQGAAVAYLQPILQNPLGTTMSGARKSEVAAALAANEMIAIEDGIYRFLAPDEAPLAAWAPDRIILIDSLSKRVAPGLTVGIVHVPAGLGERMGVALARSGWNPGGFALEASRRWIESGVIEALDSHRRADAANRQRIARGALGSLLLGDDRAYHGWLALPEPWRAEDFLAAAMRRGISLVPGSSFAVAPGHAPAAVRLALSAPGLDHLGYAVSQLASLLRQPAEPELIE